MRASSGRIRRSKDVLVVNVLLGCVLLGCGMYDLLERCVIGCVVYDMYMYIYIGTMCE